MWELMGSEKRNVCQLAELSLAMLKSLGKLDSKGCRLASDVERALALAPFALRAP